jgi:hypothetical protein
MMFSENSCRSHEKKATAYIETWRSGWLCALPLAECA